MEKKQTKAVAVNDELRAKISLLIHQSKYLLTQVEEAMSYAHDSFYNMPNESKSDIEEAKAYNAFYLLRESSDDLNDVIYNLRKILADNEVTK